MDRVQCVHKHPGAHVNVGEFNVHGEPWAHDVSTFFHDDEGAC